jgi:hypothetical protein
MMKSKIKLLCVVIFISLVNINHSNAQSDYIDLSVSKGKQTTVAVSYVRPWQLNFGKQKRWKAGLGLRLTNTSGNEQEYLTAGPARLIRGSSIPIVSLFSARKAENFDTLSIQQPSVYSLNVTGNVSYDFSAKWSVGVNIDLVGVSFGGKSTAIYKNQTFIDDATPSSFNLLLTDDLDHGSLNSELFVKYNLSQHWSLRGVYNHFFTEFKTNSIKQSFADGTVNNRFRNKASNLGLAISYTF